jgi:hypothetical protein
VHAVGPLLEPLDCVAEYRFDVTLDCAEDRRCQVAARKADIAAARLVLGAARGGLEETDSAWLAAP